MAKKDKKLKSVADLRAEYGRTENEYWECGIQIINDLFSPNGEGIPKGKYIECHSDEGIGKSTMAVQICRYLIEQHEEKVGFMDVEQALNDSLKDKMGVSKYEFDDRNAPSFLHLTPNTYGEVEETMDMMIAGGYKFIVLDSLTNTVPERRAEGSITDVAPGLKSMMQAIFLEQYKAPLARNGITLLIINQMRMSINFINTKKEPAGGRALRYNTDIRLGLRKTKDLMEKIDGINTKVGAELEMITIKNKLTYPFRAATCELYFAKGIDNIATIANLCIKKGIIKQSGAYFECPGLEKRVMGREKLYEYVTEKLDFLREELGSMVSEIDPTVVNAGIDVDDQVDIPTDTPDQK